MKLLPIIILIFASSTFYAQNTYEDVFTKSRMTWFGLDYSKVKLIQGGGVKVPADIKLRYAQSWNGLFIEESSKYDLSRHYSKVLVAKDLKAVTNANKTINVDELVTYDEGYAVSKEEVAEMVKQYDSKAAEGIGLVYIVESFSKKNSRAVVHVTFFDIRTRNILFHKKMEGKPGGAGVRNYWAKAIYDVLEQSKKKWRRWRKNAAILKN